MLHAHAAEQRDQVLLTLADVSRSALLRLPDQDCAHRCLDLLDRADALKPTLTAEFGLAQDALDQAADIVDEFNTLIGAPRSAILEARDLLDNRLDPLMRQFEASADAEKAALHQDYRNARLIVGGGSSSGEEDTPPPVEP